MKTRRATSAILALCLVSVAVAPCRAAEPEKFSVRAELSRDKKSQDLVLILHVRSTELDVSEGRVESVEMQADRKTVYPVTTMPLRIGAIKKSVTESVSIRFAPNAASVNSRIVVRVTLTFDRSLYKGTFRMDVP